MIIHHWWATLAILACVSNVVSAQDVAEKFNRIHAAISAVFPEKHFSIWEGTEGDLNGDGVSDYAAVVVLEEKEGGREERLVVFAGTSDGNYKPLSVSGRFCEPQKFYGLSSGKNALFVRVFNYADAARSDSYTLQFRYNVTLKDFELIGEEGGEENHEDGSYYRVSINYLTKTVIHSRKSGKKKKEVVVRLKSDSTILRLQGFECSGQGTAGNVYIDENFNVQNK